MWALRDGTTVEIDSIRVRFSNGVFGLVTVDDVPALRAALDAEATHPAPALGEADGLRTPPGARLVEAYMTDREVVVMGDPDPDDETHDCDAMGCGTMSHVAARFPLLAARKGAK
jgi:hypothetical protein